MIGVLSVLLVLAISLILTRVAAVALVHTGLGREAARFQARSAFTGVGFTTGEAEDVVNHPVRRRIVAWLMLVGNVGIITGMSALMISFIQIGEDSSRTGVLLAGLVAGVAALWLAGSSQWVDQRVCRTISWALNRWTSIDARDYAGLLHLRGDYGVCELRAGDGDWAANRRLGDLELSGEGLLVLGIECPGNNFIGAPGPDVEIRAGDRLILYGRTPRIAELDQRRPGTEGEQSHRTAIEEQARIEEQERRRAGRSSDPSKDPA
jgi:hypothetical protein